MERIRIDKNWFQAICSVHAVVKQSIQSDIVCACVHAYVFVCVHACLCVCNFVYIWV